MPVGAFGGKRDIITYISPTGPVYQAGTLSGNPVAMAAGLAALTQLEQADMYTSIFENTQALADGMQAIADKYNIPLTTNVAGSMFGIFFTDVKKVTNYQQAINCDTERFKTFYHGMLDEGVYLAPSAFEAGFTCAALTDEDIEFTINAARKVMATL